MFQSFLRSFGKCLKENVLLENFDGGFYGRVLQNTFLGHFCWKLYAGEFCWRVFWETFARGLLKTFRRIFWETLMGDFCRKFLRETSVGELCRRFLMENFAGQFCWRVLREAFVGGICRRALQEVFAGDIFVKESFVGGLGRFLRASFTGGYLGDVLGIFALYFCLRSLRQVYCGRFMRERHL